MILSDREIAWALDNKFISIDPEPDKSLWTSTAIDLKLDHVLIAWSPKPSPTGEPLRIRPGGKNFDIQALMEDPQYRTKITIDPHRGYDLKPGTFVLGYTRERIKLPHKSRIAGRVEGKSSLARIGVGVHVTAPTIHAGFGYNQEKPEDRGSPLQLEIFNLGNLPVVLDAGMPICQLILEEVREVPIKGYKGRFSAQEPFTMA